MASYKNFSQAVQRKHQRNSGELNESKTVEFFTSEMKNSFERNLDKWIYFSSWSRWYPDLFLDLVRPDTGGISLTLDQRVLLRSILRFVSVYGVYPRAYGKTFIEILALFLICMFYPNTEVAMTAQTEKNAAKMMADKYREIVRYWPILSGEIARKPTFLDDKVSVPYTNGAIMNVLANNQNSKGQRRRRINIEESALLDNFTYTDAVEPIVDTPRLTVGKLAVPNPEEISQRINFFTTAGFKGTDEHARSIAMIHGMAELKGEYVSGADWTLATWYGRGLSIEKMAQKRERNSAMSFAQNYASRWVGASENQLVDVGKLMSCRVLQRPEFKRTSEDAEYVFGIDVARSEKDGNNKTSVSVLKVIRNKNNSVKEIRLVNLIIISNTHNFTAQSIEIKRLYNIYDPKMSVVDVNGLGVGLKDELLKTQSDPATGKELRPWGTINGEGESEEIGAPEILYALHPQSAQTKITVTFMDIVGGGKLKLLVDKGESDLNIFSKDDVIAYAPYVQTEELINEITNLKIKYNNNGSMSIERVVSKVDKDRYTSLAYGVWWIMEFDNKVETPEGTMASYFSRLNKASPSGRVSNPASFIKKIFR